MTSNPVLEEHGPGLKPLAWITGTSLLISAVGLGVWGWLLQNREVLPDPDSPGGERLLSAYQAVTHASVIGLLTAATLIITALIIRARAHVADRYPQRSVAQSLVSFAREQPLALALFAAYAIAMVQGTTWLYPELVGWYRDVFSEHLLDNFSARNTFIGETMQRTDFRFFPLAHQDLHILSWLTAYVKVWMLVNAAELIAIVILATRFVRRLSGSDPKQGPGLLIITALLLMVHPSTAQSFFQFIYCERLLTLIFALYISAYLHYRHTKSAASFYSTWLWALIGLYVKDLAFILFLAPPILAIVLGSIGLMHDRVQLQRRNLKAWLSDYALELWLVGLVPIFLSSYTILSLLPSTFVNEDSYAEQRTILFQPDWRFWFLAGLTTTRLVLAMVNRLRLQLLDTLNITALSYAMALLLLVGLNSSRYLTLPIQLITVMNATWLWSRWLAPRLNNHLPWRISASLGTATTLALVGAESTHVHPSFASRVQQIKQTQASWLGAYTQVDVIARELKQQGEPVNIIYNGRSWLSPRRHLGRLRYDRLIEYNPKQNAFVVVDGINKGATYRPNHGDLVLNIDKKVSDLAPILGRSTYQQLYRHHQGDKSGVIFRLEQAFPLQTSHTSNPDQP